MSCHTLWRERERELAVGVEEDRKYIFLYKMLLLFMWGAEIYSLQTHGVYSRGDSAGVNSIFNLLKNQTPCGNREQLRGAKVMAACRY